MQMFGALSLAMQLTGWAWLFASLLLHLSFWQRCGPLSCPPPQGFSLLNNLTFWGSLRGGAAERPRAEIKVKKPSGQLQGGLTSFSRPPRSGHTRAFLQSPAPIGEFSIPSLLRSSHLAFFAHVQARMPIGHWRRAIRAGSDVVGRKASDSSILGGRGGKESRLLTIGILLSRFYSPRSSVLRC